jgi:hypothetical protein
MLVWGFEGVGVLGNIVVPKGGGFRGFEMLIAYPGVVVEL